MTMTPATKEVLDRVMHRAMNNGYDLLDKYEAKTYTYLDPHYLHGPGLTQVILTDHDPVPGVGENIAILAAFSLSEILYDHEFARCLWGDVWQIHLQQMVVAPNVVDYLRSNTPQ